MRPPLTGACRLTHDVGGLARFYARILDSSVEFEVDDVDAAYARLRVAGVPIVKPPTTQPWERRSVWIRDPD